MTITRCTPTERVHFRKICAEHALGDGHKLRDTEPALGTLDQRLDILIRRHGGRTSAFPPMTREQRREYELLLSSVLATREDVQS